MAYLTRIKNNQITDSTILANTKILPGSIVGSLFNAELTLSSNVTITGNLTVQGASTYLTVASTNTYVNDPLIILNNAFASTNTYDIGLLINRGDQISTALIWKEANKQFELIYTTENGTTYGAINNSGYANLKVGNLTVASVTTLSDIGAGNLTLTGDLAVNGGDLTTTASTFNLLASDATTVNAFGAATTLILGATSGTANIRNSDTNILGNATVGTTLYVKNNDGYVGILDATPNYPLDVTGDIHLTGTLRMDSGQQLVTSSIGANVISSATDLALAAGYLTGNLNLQSYYSGAYRNVITITHSPNVIITGNTSISGELSVTGDTTLTSDLAVNGGDITTTASTFNLLASNATTVNAFGAATTLIVGATTGVANIRNATTNIIGNATVGGTLDVTGAVTLTDDLAVNGGDLTTTASAFNLLNTNATTVDAFKAATDLEFGATSGTITINNPTLVGTQTSQAVYNTVATTVNAFGAAETLSLGAATGSTTVNNNFTTPGIVTFTSTQTANIFGEGALIVSGGGTVYGNLWVGGNINLLGNTFTITGNTGQFFGDANGFGALYAGVAGFTYAPYTVLQTTGNYNGYAQINHQNINTGNVASTDYIATADNGNATDTFIDMGINSSTYNVPGYGLSKINDGYVYVYGNTTTGGGNLLLATSLANDIIFATHGQDTADEQARFKNGVGLVIAKTTISNSTTSGALQVAGGAGVQGNLNVGGDVVITGNLTVQGNVTTLNTSTLDVEDLNITVAKGAASSAAADGAGLTVDGANATILYTHATTSWNLNKHLIGTSAQFSTTLGVTGDTTLTANLAVNGGDITTTASTFNLVDTNATTLNLGGAATTIDVGATSGTITINNPTLVGTQTTQAVYNTVATTVNAFGAATALAIGATSGTITIGNPTVVGTQASQDVFNTTATTVNAFGAATTLIVGATTGIANIRNATTNIIGNATVGSNLTVTGNTTIANVSATNGTFSGNLDVIQHATFTTIGTDDIITGNITVVNDAIANDLTVNNAITTNTLSVLGNILSTGSSTFNLLNSTALTVNAFGGANAITIGATTGTLTLRNATVTTPGQIISTRAGSATTGNGQIFLNGATSNRIDWAAAGTGAPAFTTRSDGTKVVFYPALSGSTVDYAIGIDSATMWSSIPEYGDSFNFKWYGAETLVANLSGTGNFTTVGDVAVNGGDLTTTAGTATVFNTDATTVNAFGAATLLSIGATSGTANIRNATTNIIGNANIKATTDAISATTGALTVAGGAGFAKNVYVANGATINSTQSAENFTVKGFNSTALIYADSNTDSVVIGGGHVGGSGGNITIQPGVTLKIDSTDTFIIPVGTTAQRPSNSGNVDVRGMQRFNSTINNLEFYDGSAWQSAGTVFTVISDRQFSVATGNPYGNVDGINDTFTIQSSSTTSATIVSINGVIQVPALAYDVSTVTLTFTEPPALGDVIDVRCLATTAVLQSLASGNGMSQFIVENTEAQIWTGASSTTKQFSIDTGGNATFEQNVLIKGKNIYDQTAIAVGTSAVVIDSFDKSFYRSAKYVISVSNSGTGEYEVSEVLVVHNGTTATRIQFGTIFTGSASLGSVTVAVFGTDIELSYTGVASGNAVKLSATYIKV